MNIKESGKYTTRAKAYNRQKNTQSQIYTLLRYFYTLRFKHRSFSFLFQSLWFWFWYFSVESNGTKVLMTLLLRYSPFHFTYTLRFRSFLKLHHSLYILLIWIYTNTYELPIDVMFILFVELLIWSFLRCYSTLHTIVMYGGEWNSITHIVRGGVYRLYRLDWMKMWSKR